MSKTAKIQEIKKIMNKAFIPFTPKATKQKKLSSTIIRQKISNYSKDYINNESSINKSETSIPNLNNSEIIKSPKEILNILLKNCLGTSLIKIEKNTKEHMNTLKLINKDFMVFKKNVNLLITGVKKKKKENEKKLLKSKKSIEIKQLTRTRLSKTPYRIRSKTYENIRNLSRENSFNNKTNKNKMSLKTIKRKNGKENKLEHSYKNGPRTSFSNIIDTNDLGNKSKTLGEKINYYKKIEKTPLRRRVEENKKNKTLKRISTTSGNINMKESKESKEIKNNVKQRYSMMITNANNTSINNESTNINSRSKKRKKNIKTTERILERKKSIKVYKKDERNLKNKLSIKQKIKIERGFKKRKSISKNEDNNSIEEKVETPIKKEIEKNASKFIFNDNLINSNINLNNDSIQKSIISLKDNSDINLITNENINIDELINEKEMESEKKKQNENGKQKPKIKNEIKELEDFNDKKPKFDDEKENSIIINKRMRSYSKNRERKNFCSWSTEKDLEGSLKDVKLMIEGVSGVLRKINICNSKSKYKLKKNLLMILFI